MIEKIENINTFILSKMLLKIIAMFISCFIIFNCIFSPVLANVTSTEISAFSDIQKDIFSAVFFVSNAIEKINFSLTSKIVANDAQKSGTQNEENKSVPCTNNDFIITGLQIQSEMLKLQHNQNNGLVRYNMLLYDYGNLSACFYEMFNKIFVFCCVVFLFFASIKKLYDNILKLNINRVNPAFMYV